MQEESAKQSNNNDRPWIWKKGQSGNPSGRPKGSITMKAWIAKKLMTMTEEEREDFISGLNKLDLLKMAEGNPAQDVKVDATVNISKVLDDLEKADGLNGIINPVDMVQLKDNDIGVGDNGSI